MIARVYTPAPADEATPDQPTAPERPAVVRVHVPTDQAPLFHVPGRRGGWYVSLLYGHSSGVDVPVRTLGRLLAGSRGEVIVARRLTPAEARLIERRRLDCDADVHAGIIAKEERRFRRPRRGGGWRP